ncbi:MAG: hypothetical protein QOJ65_1726, partial [Fimbriimonadaceae bacterium]|nr:hypothetical protein [Fimbriimonadaceae bacterium]
KILEKHASPEDLAERERLSYAVEQAVHEQAAARRQLREHLHKQDQLVGSDEIRSIHGGRRALELEAEMKRLKLIRDAVISSKGLQRAGQRPSAWWFPLVSPDGAWFRETVNSAECYLEPLT